jgi:hypothetical protein
VGNSSGPYTPSAGRAAAPITAPINPQIHRSAPEDRYSNAVVTADTATATAPTGRRPRVSASRPPTTTPMMLGAPVTKANRVMPNAENPCSVVR